MCYYTKHSSWADIQIKSASDVPFLSSSIVCELEKYNQIPKQKLIDRKNKLEQICNLIVAKDDATDRRVAYIVSNLNKRINYFENLIFLYEKQILYPDNNPLIYDDDKLVKYFFNKNDSVNKNHRYKERYLNNQSLL